jgi:ATP-dependent exoDNAse (exonuclease V) beta subunit
VVDLILETAARFEQEGGTRQDFAELLRSGASFTDETAQVETTGNTVSLMTIHGAKGLEFKVVFLADITGTGRTGGDGFLFDGELGPGFSIRDDRGGLTDTSILMQIRDLERKKELAESKRLFYVGCTRARDMLVITGCPPSKTCAVDADNWMSWLHNALGLPGDGSLAGQVTDLYRYDWISAPDEKDAEPSGVPGDEQAGMSGTAAPFEHTPGTVEQALRAPIPAVPLSAGPETISVSALLDFREDPELYFQRHVLGLETVADMEGEGYGREYGVAAHRVLERVDSHDPAHWGDMVRKAAGSLPAGLARKLESDIREFSATGLACAIAGSRSVEREQPFVHLTGDVLVRGTIDVLYTSESGAPVIVDYKTGKMPDDAGPVMERHRLQMAIYALAVWRATGRMPAEMVLAFLSSGTTRSFPCTESLLEETEALLRKTLDELSGHPLLTGKE